MYKADDYTVPHIGIVENYNLTVGISINIQ